MTQVSDELRNQKGEEAAWASAREPKGPREGTGLRSQRHPVEAGTTVAVSGTGEGGALWQELEPQKRETA